MMTTTAQQMETIESITPTPEGWMRETVCRPCAFPLWMGQTDQLNTWDEEAEEAVIHPTDAYAQHHPVLVGLIPAGEHARFECAACGELHNGPAYVFQRERLDH